MRNMRCHALHLAQLVREAYVANIFVRIFAFQDTLKKAFDIFYTIII